MWSRRQRRIMMKQLFCLCIMVICFAGCSHKGTMTKTQTAHSSLEQKEKEYDTQLLAVVKAIDIDAQKIRLYDINGNTESVYEFSDATQIYSKSEMPMVISQIELGEIVDAYFFQEEGRLTKLQISDSAWEYKKITDLSIDRTKQMMNIINRNYKYESDLSVFGEGEPMQLIDINAKDEFTIKGVGQRVYSVILTKGHGYIRLQSYDDFIGGTLEVGNDIFQKVEKNMLLVVKEGEYQLTMEHGALKGSKNVIVRRNQEVVVDMGEFKKEPGKSSKLRFVITPEEASLYINGQEMDYSKLIQLNYGNYNITVTATGYDDYTGILRVQKTDKKYETIYVDLATKGAVTTTQKPKKTAKPKTTPEAGDGTDAPDITTVPTAAPSVTNDLNHKVTIKGPNGAEVYVNGIYKGIIPVSFPKQIGTLTITLSKIGYSTKSYTVEVTDNAEDVEYTFADLVAK